MTSPDRLWGLVFKNTDGAAIRSIRQALGGAYRPDRDHLGWGGGTSVCPTGNSGCQRPPCEPPLASTPISPHPCVGGFREGIAPESSRSQGKKTIAEILEIALESRTEWS